MKHKIRQAVPLSPELEDKTFDMQGESYQLLEDGRKDEAVSKIKEAWDLLPEPKFNTSCSDNILCQLVETLARVGRHHEARPILDDWVHDLESSGYKIVDTAPFILSAENHLYAGDIEQAKAAFYGALQHGATKRDFSDKPAFYFDIAIKKTTNNHEIANLFATKTNIRLPQTPAPEDLSDEVTDRIEKLSEKGNTYFDNEDYVRAIETWQHALLLIPQPQHTYAESQWLETSIGDAYFLLGEQQNALACFQRAVSNIEENGYENPFIMLRLGQTLLENNRPLEAKEYLLRAYLFEGAEIFENDDDKYLEFLAQNVSLD